MGWRGVYRVAEVCRGFGGLLRGLRGLRGRFRGRLHYRFLALFRVGEFRIGTQFLVFAHWLCVDADFGFVGRYRGERPDLIDFRPLVNLRGQYSGRFVRGDIGAEG